MSPSKPVRSVLVLAFATAATVGSLVLPVVSASADDGTWFRDPVSAANRAAQVAVPRRPGRTIGERVRHTRATYRTRDGSVAVPARWAIGHTLVRGQAVVLQGRAFRYDNGALSASTRRAVLRLTNSLSGVRRVSCQGHADFGGTPGGERLLSRQRARAVCGLIAARTTGVSTRSSGYGIFRPVVIGGTQRNRIDNRRVVVEVVRSVPRVPSVPTSTAPAAPRLSTVEPTDTSLTLRFERPDDDGGAPVTSYQASVDGGTTWRDVAISGTETITAEITALTPETSYTVTVRAVNRVGAGPQSNSITTTTVPAPTVATAPTIVSVIRGYEANGPDELLFGDMIFTAPSSDGGEPITGYEHSLDGGPWTPLTYAGSDPYTARIDYEGNPCPHTHVIRAVNSVGPGPSSNTVESEYPVSQRAVRTSQRRC